MVYNDKIEKVKDFLYKNNYFDNCSFKKELIDFETKLADPNNNGFSISSYFQSGNYSIHSQKGENALKDNDLYKALFHLSILDLVVNGYYNNSLPIIFQQLNNPIAFELELKKNEEIIKFYKSGIVEEIIEEYSKINTYFKYIYEDNLRNIREYIQNNNPRADLDFNAFEIYKKVLKGLKNNYKFYNILESQDNFQEEKKFKVYDGLFLFKDRNKAIEYAHNTDFNGVVLCAKYNEEAVHYSNFFFIVKYYGGITLIDPTIEFLINERQNSTRNPGRRVEENMYNFILPFDKLFNKTEEKIISKELTLFQENDDVKFLGSLQDFTEDEKLYTALIMNEIKNLFTSGSVKNIQKKVTTGFMFKNNIKLKAGKAQLFIGNNQEKKNIEINKIDINGDFSKELIEDSNWMFEILSQEFGLKYNSLVSIENINNDFIGSESDIKKKMKYEFNQKIYNEMKTLYIKFTDGFRSKERNIIRQFLYDNISLDDILGSKDKFVFFKDIKDYSTRGEILEGKIPVSLLNYKGEYYKEYGNYNEQFGDWLYIGKDGIDYLNNNKIDHYMNMSFARDALSANKERKNILKYYKPDNKRRNYLVVHILSFRVLWNLLGKDNIKSFPLALKTLNHYTVCGGLPNSILNDYDPLLNLTKFGNCYLKYSFNIIIPYE